MSTTSIYRMTRVGLLATIAVALIVVLPGIGPAMAEEGRIPWFQSVAISGSTVGGQYVLTRDIIAPEIANAYAIDVVGTGVEQVEIDLNGFEVRGNSLGDAVIRVSNVRGVELRNGTVTSPALTETVVEIGVASASGKAVVEDLRISGGNCGLCLEGVPNFFVRRNLISDFASTTSSGISVRAGGFPGTVRFQGVIEGNVLRDDGAGGGGSFGIEVFHPNDGVIIRANTIRAGFTGLQLSSATGALVEQNFVAANASIGYNIANGNSLRIRNNRVEGVSQQGFSLFNLQDSLVSDNVANDCSQRGFYIWAGSAGNLFDRNIANNNSNVGFYFDFDAHDNRYGRNAAYGNAGSCGVGTAVCGLSNLCDTGTNNNSFGDNLIPGPPPC